MEMIQQLFMVAFAAFVFSILVKKLACVTINGEERKSKRTKYHRAQRNSKSKNKSKKKVHFAVHDQIATVINNKLVKLGAIKRPTKKQMFRPIGYDLNEVYLGANWIGEELMIYKELGLHLEHHKLGFGTIQVQIKTLNDKVQPEFAIDDNIDDQTEDDKNENFALDFDSIKFVN